MKDHTGQIIRDLVVCSASLALIFLPCTPLSAQHPLNDDHYHVSPDHMIAAAPAMVFLSGESVWVPGLHLKYAYGFHGGWLHATVGVTGDVVLADQTHYGLGLSLGVEPVDQFHLHLGPVLALEHGDRVLNASVGVAYTFRANGLLIGPVTEITFNANDYHWMTGLGARGASFEEAYHPRTAPCWTGASCCLNRHKKSRPGPTVYGGGVAIGSGRKA